jgi:hypothetical protein
MTSSLTTFDGFPRDDIDIAQGTPCQIPIDEDMLLKEEYSPYNSCAHYPPTK